MSNRIDNLNSYLHRSIRRRERDEERNAWSAGNVTAIRIVDWRLQVSP
ncbi:MAG TPA: hypothetical protein VM940_05470 [Chthoniobacterales bacterium]|nr:hypothetical protein [Chthoniobacterales bacterium]